MDRSRQAICDNAEEVRFLRIAVKRRVERSPSQTTRTLDAGVPAGAQQQSRCEQHQENCSYLFGTESLCFLLTASLTQPAKMIRVRLSNGSEKVQAAPARTKL